MAWGITFRIRPNNVLVLKIEILVYLFKSLKKIFRWDLTLTFSFYKHLPHNRVFADDYFWVKVVPNVNFCLIQSQRLAISLFRRLPFRNNATQK